MGIFKRFREGISTKFESDVANAPIDATRDPYEVLGILRTATDDEVRQAYSELSDQLHKQALVVSFMGMSGTSTATQRQYKYGRGWAKPGERVEKPLSDYKQVKVAWETIKLARKIP